MKPLLLHMLGIPGAGKTTFLDLLAQSWEGPLRPVLLGFDQVMQAMPGYQAMPDKVAAFAQFELPAREEGYRLLRQSMAEGRSILFDNGGSAASHVELLKQAADQGYRVVLVSIRTTIEAAQRRVDARSITEGRHTPMTYLEDRMQKIAALEPLYRDLTPHFYEIENTGLDYPRFEAACRAVASDILSLTRMAEESPCARS